MSATKGNPLTEADLQSWYNALNSIISTYSDGLSQLADPASVGSIIESEDINNFFNKLTEMKSDKFLGTVASLYPTYSVVSDGTIIYASSGNPMSQAISSDYLGKVVCKNTATNSSGTCNSGNKGCGTQSVATDSSKKTYASGHHNVNHFFQSLSNGFVGGFITYTGNAKKSSGTHSSGAQTANGAKSCGTTIDIICSCTTKSKN